jgi:outer membrane protein assembly factor BamD
MKNFKYLLFIMLFSLLVSCASSPTGSEAYKSKPAENIFTMGERSLSKKHYKDAVRELEAFDALYPFDPRAEQTLLDLIYAYYKSSDPDSGIAAADRYIRLYPMSRRVAYALYLRGIISMERNHSWIYNAFPVDPAKRDLASLQQAFSDFQRLVSLYPDSIYAVDAQKRMIYIKMLLARHELQIAQFYFQRHAYVAAVNRASYVVEHLPGTPQVREALMIMAKSYRALGEVDCMNETLEVLRLNYPSPK